MTESFAYLGFREKCRTTWACISVVTCGENENTLNLIYELWHTTGMSRASWFARAKNDKKKTVEWTEGKIIKFILPETHRERMGEAGEKRTRGDSRWYLYKDWSAAKIIDLSIFLPSSRFPSCRFFLLYSSVSFLPTYLSLSSIYNIYLSLLSLSLSLESRVLNTRGKVDI